MIENYCSSSSYSYLNYCLYHFSLFNASFKFPRILLLLSTYRQSRIEVPTALFKHASQQLSCCLLTSHKSQNAPYYALPQRYKGYILYIQYIHLYLCSLETTRCHNIWHTIALRLSRQATLINGSIVSYPKEQLLLLRSVLFCSVWRPLAGRSHCLPRLLALFIFLFCIPCDNTTEINRAGLLSVSACANEKLIQPEAG